MREIIFRGKRSDTGEWIYGDLLHNVDAVKTREQEQGIQRVAKSFVVIPETVGQFTGLTDKNGTRVFEGDIVKLTINRNYIFSVDWVNDCGMYCLKCLNRHPKHNFEALDTDFTVFNGDETEIIGNIHDNADLLGENNAKEQ